MNATNFEDASSIILGLNLCDLMLYLSIWQQEFNV